MTRAAKRPTKKPPTLHRHRPTKSESDRIVHMWFTSEYGNPAHLVGLPLTPLPGLGPLTDDLRVHPYRDDVLVGWPAIIPQGTRLEAVESVTR